MLILSGSDSRIELDIVGYQFASAKHDGWDSEWLQVSGRAESPRGRWKFNDPCLTTFELKALASWLREVPVGGPDRELSFTEPNLRFEHVEEPGGDALFVWLSQEASPPWATEVERFQEGYVLRIPFASINFVEAAEGVERLCQKYPERAHRGGG
jgi:hypothetical protein